MSMTVITRPRAAIPATAQRMERLPSSPIMKAAMGGPATQEKEKIARVFMIPETEVPMCFWWANSSPMPTPAGPPRATSASTAQGRLLATASAEASRIVARPHPSSGLR